MAFQQNSFQHNAFQVALPGVAAAGRPRSPFILSSALGARGIYNRRNTKASPQLFGTAGLPTFRAKPVTTIIGEQASRSALRRVKIRVHTLLGKPISQVAAPVARIKPIRILAQAINRARVRGKVHRSRVEWINAIRSNVFAGTASDTLTAVETQTSLVVYPVEISEPLSSTDTTTSAAIFNSSVAETSTLVSSESSTGVFLANVDESVTATDTISSTAVLASSVAETGTIAETVSATLASNKLPNLRLISQVSLKSRRYKTPSSTQLAGTFGTPTSKVVAEILNATDQAKQAANKRARFDIARAVFISPISGAVNISDSVNEVITAAESQSSLVVYPVTIDDTVNASDSVSSTATLVNSVAETITGSDSVSSTGVLASSIAETGTVVETITGEIYSTLKLPKLRVLSQALLKTRRRNNNAPSTQLAGTFGTPSTKAAATLQDITQQAKRTAILRVRSSPARISFIVPVKTTNNSIVNEVLSAVDTINSTGTFNISVSEVLSATDSQSSNIPTLKRGPRVLSQAINTRNKRKKIVSKTQLISAFGSSNLLPPASVWVVGSSKKRLAITRRLTASGVSLRKPIRSNFNVFNSTTNETLSAVETVSSAAVFNSSVNDTSSLAETINSTLIANTLLNETLSAVETVSSAAVLQVSVDEVISAVETESASSILQVSVDEVIGVVETLSTSVVFNVSVAESLVVTETTNGLTGDVNAEQLSVVDSVTSVAVYQSSVAESLAVTETNNGLTGAGNEDQLTAADSVTSVAVYQSSVAETLSTAETLNGLRIVTDSVSETLNAAENNSLIAVFNVLCAEAGTAIETLSSGQNINENVNEIINTQENMYAFDNNDLDLIRRRASGFFTFFS